MSLEKRHWIGVAVVGFVAGTAGLLGFVSSVPRDFSWQVVTLGTVALIVGGRLTGALIKGAFPTPSVGDGTESSQLAQQVYGELDDFRARLLELEERQDFSERLIADRTEESAEKET